MTRVERVWVFEADYYYATNLDGVEIPGTRVTREERLAEYGLVEA